MKRSDVKEVSNQRPAVRRANDDAVRKLQFETARRILFSTRVVPGSNPPREWWTSAGFLRYNDIQFDTEFQLGEYTLKVTRGAVTDNLIFAAPVWLKMRGRIGSWYNSDEGMRPSNTTPDIIVAGGEWVCVGILKSDNFVAVIPNFLNLCAVQLFEQDDGYGEKSEFFYPTPDKRADYLDATAEGSIGGAYSTAIDESRVYERIKEENSDLDSEDSDDREKLQELVDDDMTFEIFTGDVKVDWAQLQPDAQYPVYVFQGQGPLHEEDRMDEQHGMHKTRDGGRVKSYIDMSGEAYWVSYNGPIPFDQLATYLDHRVPEQFIASFLPSTASVVPIDRAKAIFSFMGPNFVWRNTQQTTIWHAADIAAVAFVQSYLVYILSGPDKRRFIPDPFDGSPMKETQLPPCLLRLQPDAKKPEQLILVVAANGKEVVSGSVYFRFFFETLASRAYAASLKALGISQLENPGGVPKFLDKFSKVMAGSLRTDALVDVFAAMEAVENRSNRTEFLSAEIKEQQAIGRRFGLTGGFGPRGGGGSGGGMLRNLAAAAGGGGAFRGSLGTARLGLRGPGYSSRSLFRPVLGHRWGRGLGFGGYRWGYWDGWRFPWVYAYGLWYPWWYYLDPVYYRMRRPYIDPVTGVAYGIPPSPPGSWGPVGAPPQGLSGYATPPEAIAGYDAGLVASSVDAPLETAEIGANAVSNLLARLGKGLGRGRRKFERMAVKHTLAELDKGNLNAIAVEWGALISSVSGPILRILNDTFNTALANKGYVNASQLLVGILSRHFDTLKASATTSKSFFDSLLRADTFAVEWSSFWAALSIDAVWVTLNTSAKTTLEEVIASAPGAAQARRIFLLDAQTHTTQVAMYLRGMNNREECLDAARTMGQHLDEYFSYKHSAIGFSVEQLKEAWSLPSQTEKIASVVYAELDAKK